jgi:hypothetical protein
MAKSAVGIAPGRRADVIYGSDAATTTLKADS